MIRICISALAVLTLACSNDDKPEDTTAPESSQDTMEDTTNDTSETDDDSTDQTDPDSTTTATNSTPSDSTEPNSDTSVFDTSVSESKSESGTTESDPVPVNPGAGPTVGNCAVFPADNEWNKDISNAPLHANSEAFINSIGGDRTLHPDFGTEWEGAPIGIPYVVVSGSQQMVDITYTAYGDESDQGPMPIPLDAAIEGGPDGDGDRHTLVLDEDNCTLYELYRAFPTDDGFEAESGTVWDLRRNEDHPEGCTSADAAGLPIFPGLARYDEVVEHGEVLHALRFTVSSSQRGYIYPARHYASSNTDADLAPMGLRVRMKADYACDDYATEVQVLCAAMKRFGMIVADNGSNWYVSGAPDPRWNDDNLHDLGNIPGNAFEVVDTGPVVTSSPDCQL